MRKSPYHEILNLRAELKEYKRLCKCKSKEFIYYLDWKKYIINQLSKLDNLDKIENYKHFLLNHSRVNKNINTYYVTLLIFCFNLYISKINVEYDWLTLTITLIFILFQILFQSNANDREYCFYCDLLEIVEETEEKYKLEELK